MFEDNRQCEEWALFRGDCKMGGRKITGFDNEAEVYCAINGGDVVMNVKPVRCDLPIGKVKCSADDFYKK